MDLAGIQGAVKELESKLPAEINILFDRFDLSVTKAVSQIDAVLTEHETKLKELLSKLQLRPLI